MRGFFKISTEKERIAGFEDAADLIQELKPSHPVKVPDGAAEKKYKKVLAFTTLRRHFKQAIKVFTLEAEDADAIDVA
jgi:hypothetical protein